MYYNGQVVHDLDRNMPFSVGDPNSGFMFAWEKVPARTSPYVDLKDGKIVMPYNAADAYDKLKAGVIGVSTELINERKE